MVAADARTAITFALSPGQAHDAPEGRKLLHRLGKAPWPIHLLMDRAYEGAETRQLALDLGFIPVVPAKQNRITAWEYNRVMYKRRNEIERLFVDSKPSGASSRGLRSSISCSSLSSTSRSSPMGCASCEQALVRWPKVESHEQAEWRPRSGRGGSRLEGGGEDAV